MTPRALVTGASSGIGRALAVELAKRGWKLVLVARDEHKLAALAEQLPNGPHDVISEDLSTDSGMLAICARIDTDVEPITLLVTAAGTGTSGAFPWSPMAEEEMMLRINVLATLRLTHGAAHAMKRRGIGGIMTVASTAAYWSAGTYAASKSWVLLTTLGLRAQLENSGVRVMALSPGFTKTEFHARSQTDPSGVKAWMWLDAEDVARQALDDFDAGKPVCVPGRRYRALVETVRHLPPGGRSAVLRRLAPLRSQPKETSMSPDSSQD